MTLLRWSDKDPADVWDYTLNAAEWMDSIGDTLASVAASASPSGLTIGDSATTPEGLATVRLSDGTPGTDYTVTLRMTTAGGRVLERSVMLYVAEL